MEHKTEQEWGISRVCKPTLSQKHPRAMIISKSLEDFNIKSTDDWGRFRQNILNTNHGINVNNIDALTLAVCTTEEKYDLALLYLEYLKEANVDLNLATMGKYLKLLYLIYKDKELDEKTEKKILEICEHIRTTYSTLDQVTLDNLIHAISLTKKWRLGLDYLEETKVLALPTSTAFSALIAAAFSNDNNELAWSLWTQLLEQQHKVIFPTVYSAYFQQLKKKKTASASEVEILFSFLHKSNMKIHPDSVETFIAGLKSLGISVKSSSCNNRGVCQSCRSQLEVFEPTEKEFNDLKQKFFQNVVIGKNVFAKTTPAEVERFQMLISQSNEFDVIIDGLNVAYSVGVKQTPLVFSHLVAAVVSDFVKKGKKVLVFGRTHMNKWPKENWSYVQQNATLFLTEDLSQDDPYLLYAALHCGKNTILVSRDLMRSHKFLLMDMHLRNLFEKWLLQHQYQLVKVLANGKPLFKKPHSYSQITQKNGKYWHIPYMNKEGIDNSFFCVHMRT